MSEEIKNDDIVEEPVAVVETTEAELPVLEETKPSEAVEPENVISSGSQNVSQLPTEVAGITSVENGVIGTGKVERKPKSSAKKEEVKSAKVAVFSTKNVTWNGVGKVYKGYNLVTPDQADKWLTRSHVRPATPEEVAREFNK